MFWASRKHIYTMLAVLLGWAFEAFDFMLFSMLAIPIMKSLGIERVEFGLAISIGLLGTVVGGMLIAPLADNYGRVKVLLLSLLLYVLATLGIALSYSYHQLLLFRFLIGLGLGSEWSTGMTLVAETIPRQRRGLAIGIVQSGWPLGVLFSIIDTVAIYPLFGWRVAFAIAALPAFLVLFMTTRLNESELWLTKNVEKKDSKISILKLFAKPYLPKVLIGLTIDVLAMFSYWMFWSWIPVFLSQERGFTVVKSAEWLASTQIGAFLGYISYGYLQDKLGRRPTWTFFTAVEATMIILYTLFVKEENALLALGFFLGYFTGYWSGFGVILSELFPTEIRSTALGFIFNTGRGINFISPIIVAILSTYWGWSVALSTAALAAYTTSILIWLFPETKAKQLE